MNTYSTITLWLLIPKSKEGYVGLKVECRGRHESGLGQRLKACLTNHTRRSQVGITSDEPIKPEMGKEIQNRFLYDKEDSGSTTEEDLAGYKLWINLTV